MPGRRRHLRGVAVVVFVTLGILAPWPVKNALNTGIDTVPSALECAREVYGSDRVRFGLVQEFRASEDFELCYVNGVFHHISPSERVAAIRLIRQALVTGGHLAFLQRRV